MLYEFLPSRLQSANTHKFSLFYISKFFLSLLRCYFSILQMENSWTFIIFSVVPLQLVTVSYFLPSKTLKTWTDFYLFV